MALQWPSKDPEDVLDYDIDYSVVLAAQFPDFAADTITSSSWTLVNGDVTLGAELVSPTGLVTKIWLSGGTIDVLQEVRNDIVSAQGRVVQQTVYLNIAEN